MFANVRVQIFKNTAQTAQLGRRSDRRPPPPTLIWQNPPEQESWHSCKAFLLKQKHICTKTFAELVEVCNSLVFKKMFYDLTLD